MINKWAQVRPSDGADWNRPNHRGLIKCDKAGLTSFLRLPIHDEVVASLPKVQAHDLAREIGECLRTQIRGVDFVTEPEVAGRSWGSLYMTEEDRKVYDLCS